MLDPFSAGLSKRCGLILRIFDTSNGKSSRREFLRIGTAALGGPSLPGLLATKASAGISAVGRPEVIRDKAVVFLNRQRGPTHFETFDPKMTASQEIRRITSEVKTRLSGVTFEGTLPMLSGLGNRMAIVRSYRHGISSQRVVLS